MKTAKQGDTIEWDFKDEKYNHLPEHLRGKTFTGKVSVVFHAQKEYGVYAVYGQDYVGFDECKIIETL